jgi:hypothetical protein
MVHSFGLFRKEAAYHQALSASRALRKSRLEELQKCRWLPRRI